MTEALPQFVDANGQIVDDATQSTDQPAAAEAQATSGRRGRPRSEEAIARDEAVLAQLDGDVVKTRNEIAEALGFTGGLTYLSLYRLHHEGRVVRVSDETTKRAWRRATPEEREAYLNAQGETTTETPTEA